MVAPVAEVTEQHLVLVRRVLDILQYLALVRRVNIQYIVLVGWVLNISKILSSSAGSYKYWDNLSRQIKTIDQAYLANQTHFAVGALPLV